jgi:hypothetical protein
MTGETKAVRINEIVEKQIPEAKGTKLSKDILTGQVGWWTHRAKWGKGRLMVSQPLTGMACSFSCGNCAVLCSRATLDPYTSIETPVDQFGSLGAVSLQQCLATCGQCGGTPQGPGSGFVTWSSSNTSIATLYSGQHSSTASFKGMATGTTTGDVSAIEEGCDAQGSGPITVAPTITGSNTVWWFNGQNPSGYSTSITLQSSGGSSTTWSVSGNTAAVQLSTTSGSSTTITATSSAWSSTSGDVKITATANGLSSQPFAVTTRQPYKLVAGTIQHNCDSTYGYSDFLNYTIYDQLSAALPSGVPLNENWTTSVVDDYSGANWRRQNPGNFTTSGAGFADNIQGEAAGFVPTAVCSGSGVKVQHWGQDWYIGSLTIASGVRVQSDVLQKYIDHALHQSIVSPAP